MCIRDSLVVVGVDLLGAEVVRLVLGHGDDPTALLAEHGWEVRRVRDITSHTVGMHVLTISFEVEPRPASSLYRRARARRGLRLGDQLARRADDAVLGPYQRRGPLGPAWWGHRWRRSAGARCGPRSVGGCLLYTSDAADDLTRVD